ncbi:MAG TPA: glycosyltransferase family 4 protein [Pyrinomonadaceae bacterium]|nr:glycosyltransferase family 4 protein [Pyrinomonadaceae bacterium]
MTQPAVLFLLDWQASSWSAREEFFRQLSAKLRTLGITPLLTLPEGFPKEFRKRLEDAGAQVTACSYHNRRLRYWAHIRNQTRKYEVLLVQVRFFNYFTLLLWMSRLSGITRIIFTEANSGEWSDRGDWRGTLVRLRAALACLPVTKFIAISEFIKRRLAAVGVPENRISVVYNGIDTNRYTPDPVKREILEREFSGDSGTLFVLYAASLLEWKRPELTLSICAELTRRGVPIKLLMAGAGPMRASLEAMTDKLEIQDHVCWLGHHEELERLFQGADVFLHTAKGEAFGNVLAEAMACGIPVVVTRSGAAAEVIEEGATGLLIDPGPDEAKRAADAIESLWKNPKRRAEMGQAGIRRARLFTVEACVENTLAVYSEVTGGRIAALQENHVNPGNHVNPVKPIS